MTATITIDEKLEELLDEATKYTGINDRARLLEQAVEDLIQREVGKRLIALGGSDPNATAAPRRRARSK